MPPLMSSSGGFLWFGGILVVWSDQLLMAWSKVTQHQPVTMSPKIILLLPRADSPDAQVRLGCTACPASMTMAEPVQWWQARLPRYSLISLHRHFSCSNIVLMTLFPLIPDPALVRGISCARIIAGLCSLLIKFLPILECSHGHCEMHFF